jgi:hypothetical protein
MKKRGAGQLPELDFFAARVVAANSEGTAYPPVNRFLMSSQATRPKAAMAAITPGRRRPLLNGLADAWILAKGAGCQIMVLREKFMPINHLPELPG